MNKLKIKAADLECIKKEAESILKYLEQLSPESEDYSTALENYNKLRKLIIDIEREDSNRLDQNVHKFISYTVDVGKFLLLLTTYCGLYKIGLKFEETGSVSSHPMRDLIGSMNPFRRK